MRRGYSPQHSSPERANRGPKNRAPRGEIGGKKLAKNDPKIAQKLAENTPRAPWGPGGPFWDILGTKKKSKILAGRTPRAQGPFGAGLVCRRRHLGPLGPWDQWTGPKGGPVDRAQGGTSGQGPRGDQWTGPRARAWDQGPGPGPGTRTQGPGLVSQDNQRGPKGVSEDKLNSFCHIN